MLVLSLESLLKLSGDRNYVLFLFFFFSLSQDSLYYTDTQYTLSDDDWQEQIQLLCFTFMKDAGLPWNAASINCPLPSVSCVKAKFLIDVYFSITCIWFLRDRTEDIFEEWG